MRLPTKEHGAFDITPTHIGFPEDDGPYQVFLGRDAVYGQYDRTVYDESKTMPGRKKKNAPKTKVKRKKGEAWREFHGNGGGSLTPQTLSGRTTSRPADVTASVHADGPSSDSIYTRRGHGDRRPWLLEVYLAQLQGRRGRLSGTVAPMATYGGEEQRGYGYKVRRKSYKTNDVQQFRCRRVRASCRNPSDQCSHPGHEDLCWCRSAVLERPRPRPSHGWQSAHAQH